MMDVALTCDDRSGFGGAWVDWSSEVKLFKATRMSLENIRAGGGADSVAAPTG